MNVHMMKIVASLLFVFATLTACSGDSDKTPKLMVFAAASLNEVMSELGQRFEQEQGIGIEFNFAGSNVLAHQLLAAPVADLFVSANRAWMQRLGQAKRIVPGSRRAVLGNRLVVIANRAATVAADPRDLFCTPRFEHLSIGNPDVVPAGIYAREWLEKLPCYRGSAWDAVSGRIAPAPNVRAALGLVEADRDVPGIVYATDAAMSDKVNVVYEVTGSDAPVITYHAAIVNNGSNHEAAQRFLDFMGSAAAAEIFHQHAFIRPQED